MRMQEPESQYLDYKPEWSEAAKETMIAFANGLGGTLKIGVADSGEAVGCNYAEVERAAMSFARFGVEPPIEKLVTAVQMDVDGKAIARIGVAPGRDRPYCYKGKPLMDGGAYIRFGSQTVAATQEEVLEIARRGVSEEWESRPSRDQRLTFAYAERFFKDNGLPFDEAAWVCWGILDKDRKFTNLAWLISDQCETRIIFNIYHSNGRLARSESISGSVLEQIARGRIMLESINAPFINKNTGKQEREDIFLWPEPALHAAFINCLIHRDYSSRVQVAVNVFCDKIVFISYGVIPEEISLQEALLPGVSICRNLKLLELFSKLRRTENGDAGLWDIVREYQKYAKKPDLRRVGRTLVIELPKINADNRKGDDAVLLYLAESTDGRSRAEIESWLDVSRPTVMKVLNDLMAQKKIAKRGRGPRVRYFLA